MTIFLLLPLLLLKSFDAANTLPSCSSFASQGYDCVPYYLCKDGYIVTDGEGVIDPRGLAKRRQPEKVKARITNWRPEDASCPVIFDVCCKDFDFSEDQISTQTAASLPAADVVTCEALRPDTTVSVVLFLSHRPTRTSRDVGTLRHIKRAAWSCASCIIVDLSCLELNCYHYSNLEGFVWNSSSMLIIF